MFGNSKLKIRVPYEITSKPDRIQKLARIIYNGKLTPTLAKSGYTISVNQVIKNVINQKFDQRIFLRKSPVNGGTIRLYVDCSGSMRNYPEVGSFVFDLWSALDQKRIKFDVIAFSSQAHNRISMLQKLTKKSECGCIHDDDRDYHDDLGNALNCSKRLFPLNGQVLNLIITDGFPEAEQDSEEIRQADLIKDIQKQIVQIENTNQKFFCIMLNKYPELNKLYDTFRNKVYQTEDLDNGVEKLCIRINDFLKSLER